MGLQENIEVVAKRARERYQNGSKVFPSLIIAQYGAECSFGTSNSTELIDINNIFSLNDYGDGVCTSANGHIMHNAPQDDGTGNWIYGEECFYTFATVEDAVDGLIEWYTNRPKYSPLLECDNADDQYEMPQKLGFATDIRYTSTIKKLVDEYNLKQYDNFDKGESNMGEWTYEQAIGVLKALYKGCFGRDYTPGENPGLENDLMGQTTRVEAFSYLLTTPEFKRYEATCFAYRVMRCGENASENELRAWVDSGEDDDTLINDILYSDEFNNRYGV